MALTFRLYVFISMFCMPSWVNACSMTFQGDEFLKMSVNKGVGPESNCYEINLADNTFYAPPNKGCVLLFDSHNWLATGWVFENIQGKGGFTISSKDNTIAVTLNKKGGFTLKSLTVSSTLESCNNIKLDDVL